MKKLLLLSSFALLIFIVGCEKEQIPEMEESSTEHILPKKEINKRIQKSFDQNQVFKWDKNDAQLIHSALHYNTPTLAIGYKPAALNDVENLIGRVSLEDSDWSDAREKILGLIYESFRNTGISGDQKPLRVHEKLPVIFLETQDGNLIETLSDMPEVRYLEPMDYQMQDTELRSSKGCSGEPQYINPDDYTNISPEAEKPWTFDKANIEAAWSNSQGNNVGICIIDTGGSEDQENLNGEFTEGDSPNRYSERQGTYYTGRWWWRTWDGDHDKCGHGTSMSGAAAAPRGLGYAPTGVAYKSNLLMIRAVEDVIISSSNEKEGVADALVIAGDRNDMHIVSMSIGTPFWSGTVADGVYYAHNKGKMIFAAGGTSLSWTNWYGVIFPANMNQTVAVTGVVDQEGLEECYNCHKGDEIDFTYVMERSNNSDRNQPGLALSGEDALYVGGSSIATASTAGIAALVWAQNLNLTRSEVFQELKESASEYPQGTSDFGYGNINASLAVD